MKENKENIKICNTLLFFSTAIFKQRGYDVKELPDDEYEPVINCRGMLKVASQLSVLIQ